jgi:integrase
LTASTVGVLREWLVAHPGEPDSPLFPSANGTPLSTDAVGWLITKYATAAAVRCPSLTGKRVTPHTLRHFLSA